MVSVHWNDIKYDFTPAMLIGFHVIKGFWKISWNVIKLYQIKIIGGFQEWVDSFPSKGQDDLYMDEDFRIIFVNKNI